VPDQGAGPHEGASDQRTLFHQGSLADLNVFEKGMHDLAGQNHATREPIEVDPFDEEPGPGPKNASGTKEVSLGSKKFDLEGGEGSKVGTLKPQRT